MIEKLKGTGVALVSPMHEDLSIDFDGLSKLIDHVIDGGVDYLVLLGTTGESPTISWQEKLAMLDFCIDKIQKSVPLVFGLGGNNTSDLVGKLDELKNREIDAILSASPYYNKPPQEGIFKHYSTLADKSRFPIIVYNVPHRTASNVLAETTLKLSQHPNIIGIKEASRDLDQCRTIANSKPEDFLLISGDDVLTFAILSLGGEGVISVLANAYPEKFVEMVKTTLSKDFVKGEKLNDLLKPLYELCVKEGSPSSVKAALASLSICSTDVRLPLIHATANLVEEFESISI
ncbi:MAG: 4-hydroxy-tetrahydrodipicolinate synthase [Cytophagales bacterium]|nr:4-hydroxy-tetrahydrodipicolinate synthase [Cytophagales bacterium]